MRQQLSLFPEVAKKPTLTLLEPSVSESQECVRLNHQYEKTLPLSVQYHPECHKVLEMSSSRLGDWAEKKVHHICLSLGIEVYENISCVGLADLVIYANNNLYMLDVKIAARNIDHKTGVISWQQKHTDQISKGVYGVCVVPAATGVYCRWFNVQKGSRLTPIHPPGLKDLWLPLLPSYYRTVA